jgi:hypothetical protein
MGEVCGVGVVYAVGMDFLVETGSGRIAMLSSVGCQGMGMTVVMETHGAAGGTGGGKKW